MKIFFLIVFSSILFGEQVKCLVLQNVNKFKVLDKYQLEINLEEKPFKKLELFELISKDITLPDGISKAVHLRKGKSDFFVVSSWKELAASSKIYNLKREKGHLYTLERNADLVSLDFQNRYKMPIKTIISKMYSSKNYHIVESKKELFWLKKSVKVNIVDKRKKNNLDEINSLVSEVNDKLKSFSRAFNNANGKTLAFPYWKTKYENKFIQIKFFSSEITLSRKSIHLMKEELIDNIYKLRLGKVKSNERDSVFFVQVNNE